jgi:STE24 endopeptidase
LLDSYKKDGSMLDFGNGPALLITFGLLLAWAVRSLSRVMDARTMDPRLPPEMEGYLDEKGYQRSQEYARARLRFEAVSETVSTAVLLAFLWGGGFGWLDGLTRSFGWSELLTGLVFIGLLAAGGAILGLPFSIYHTFVLEERFGFNKTTPGLFILDLIKGWGVAALLGGALLAVVLRFFEAWGPSAWVWCWLFYTMFLAAVQFAAPLWILPLFNKFTPMPEGELRGAIEAYAQANALPLSGIFLMDGSKRSTKSNAFVTGLGAKKRIALFDTLVSALTREEIVAVLAHEAGHAKLRHTLMLLGLAMARGLALFYLLSWVLRWPGAFAALGAEPSPHFGLVVFGLLWAPAGLIAGVAFNAVSRKLERAADAFAARTIPSPKALAMALRRLAVGNLSNLRPHPLTVALEYGHPPVLERIRRLETPPGRKG